MATIKSGDSTEQLRIDPISNAGRFTMYDSAGNEVDKSVPVPIPVTDVTVQGDELITALNVLAYKAVVIQLTGIWTGTVKIEASNTAGSNYDDIAIQDMGEIDTPYVLTATTPGFYKVPVAFEYIKATATVLSSGTVTGSAFGFKEETNTGQISSTGQITIAAAQTLDNLDKLGGVAVSMGAGQVDAGTQRVVLPDAAALSTDFYLTGVGAVDVNSRMLRTGACQLIAAIFTSYAATPRHIKLYDTATAPTAGVGTPVLVLSRASSGNNAYPLPAGGYPFVNGIGMTFVQGAANNSAIGTATVDGSLTTIFT